jgi:FAD-dependent oxidoreductase domain-containing protein 1
MDKRSFDVIIVGGGIMGCSTVYHLMKANHDLEVLIIEKDPSYEFASTSRSMANVRIQFSLKQNTLISQHAIKILASFENEMAVDGNRPYIAYHQEGNLFLVDQDNFEQMQRAYEMQDALGGDIEWWDCKTIKERYPLYDPNKYLAGTFGAKDGHLDAYAVLMAYRAKARDLGASYLHGEVVSIVRGAGKVEGIRLASGDSFHAPKVINCTGAWCNQICESIGISLPIKPVQRQVFAFDPATKPDRPLPLTILPSGLYFRTETGGLILVGKSLDEDRVGLGFDWSRRRFVDHLWPELWEFVPTFDRLKLVRGWSGLYAVNTFDGNAILGEWPGLKGFFLCNGFSGHGLQQAPAVGRYMSELILEQKHILDLSIFSPQRLLDKEPIAENGLV